MELYADTVVGHRRAHQLGNSNPLYVRLGRFGCHCLQGLGFASLLLLLVPSLLKACITSLIKLHPSDWQTEAAREERRAGGKKDLSSTLISR